MPYSKTKELPKGVEENLPKKAQETYMKVFNNAWKQYKEAKARRKGSSREETAHRVAWAAVKKEYKKKQDKWVKK